jgi:Protein of unknown function (DUF551)
MASDGWISVKDRLPEYAGDVLVCNRGGSRAIAWFNNNFQEWRPELEGREVTHWMPLPAFPEAPGAD